MKALLKKLKGPEGMSYEDMPEPKPAKGEIKIKVHAAGICGTDVHILKDEYPAKFPVVMGHEYSGVIHEVGEGVTAFKPGDRVVSLTAVVTCGSCKYCSEGLLMLCSERLSIGSGVNGAFAEYLTVPANLAFKIPDGVSLDEAAACEPLACVVRGVIERGNVKPGDYVYVSGPGLIGQLTMQVAAASGAKVVMAGTSTDMERLKLAASLGASETIIVDKEDVLKRAEEITEGQGFDVAFECSGAAPSADTCLKVLKKTGYYGQVGLFGKKVEFDHDLALMKEINITNSYASERTSWEIALRLLKFKLVNITPLLGPFIPLEDWKKAFDMAINKEGYKIMLKPNKE
jgi:L-iditol 2-dehydrogenase